VNQEGVDRVFDGTECFEVVDCSVSGYRAVGRGSALGAAEAGGGSSVSGRTRGYSGKSWVEVGESSLQFGTAEAGVEHAVVVDVPRAEILLDDIEVIAVRLARVVDRVVQNLGATPAHLVGVEPLVVVPAELAVAVVDRVLLGRRQVIDVVVVLENLCHVIGREVAVVHCWGWCGRLVVCWCVSPLVLSSEAAPSAGH
jgi:hypothetical protein